jgi:hypothetical protein
LIKPASISKTAWFGSSCLKARQVGQNQPKKEMDDPIFTIVIQAQRACGFQPRVASTLGQLANKIPLMRINPNGVASIVDGGKADQSHT